MSKFRDLVLQGLHFVRRFCHIWCCKAVQIQRLLQKHPMNGDFFSFVAQLMSQNSLHGAVNVVAGHLLQATPPRTNRSEKVDDLGRMENLNWDTVKLLYHSTT